MSPGRTPTSEEVVQCRAKQHGIELLPLREAQLEVNDKMSAGWIMIETPCPISGYPLLKDPTSGQVWSVRCQMPVVPELTAGRPPSQSPGRHESRASAGNDRQAQSERIAEKIAEGWDVAGEICPVTKSCMLLLDPQRKLRWSPALGQYLDANDQPIQEQENQQQREEEKGSKAAMPSRDAISKLIGEKLLAGWTMLGEDCPVTQRCPLMYDPKTKQKWSAALGDFVPDAEKEADEPQQQEYQDPLDPAVSMHKSKESDLHSKRMGEKLLQGWAMLEEICPRTGLVPLMKEPKTGRLYSAAIDGFVDLEQGAQQQEPLKEEDEEQVQRSPNQADDTFESYSSLIGQKLLLGWTMMEQVCPVTGKVPLMKEPGTDRLYSAALGDFITEDNGKQVGENEKKEAQPTRASAKDQKASTPTQQLRRGKQQGSSDQWSARIGEKLLAGWTMLGQVCPETGAVPLMQEPHTGRKYSAALDDFIDSSRGAENPLQKQAQRPLTPVEENMDQFFVGSWKKTADKDLEQDLADFEKIGRGENIDSTPNTGPQGSVERKPTGARSTAVLDKQQVEVSSTKSVLSGVSVNGDTREELERAEATIRSKLRECRAALASVEVGIHMDPSHIASVKELVYLTGACAETLRSFGFSKE